MNKTEFLEELAGCLAVLEEKEQQDILEEYTQHIDLKIDSGLSEEEAIRDFGDLSQLAAEILEAYHVNPDYTRRRPGPALSAAAPLRRRIGNFSRGFIKRTGRFFRGAGTVATDRFRAILKGIRSALSSIRGRRLPIFPFPIKTGRHTDSVKPEYIFHEEPLAQEQDEGSLNRSPIRTGTSGLGRAAKGVCRGLRAFLSGCISLAVSCAFFCLRWAWNAFLLMVSIMSGCLALTSLYVLAVFMVWQFQGYPFAGITLICLGTVLCSSSFTVLCISLLKIRKKKPDFPLSMQSRITEEVQNA